MLNKVVAMRRREGEPSLRRGGYGLSARGGPDQEDDDEDERRGKDWGRAGHGDNYKGRLGKILAEGRCRH